jgi:hypothetical protein
LSLNITLKNIFILFIFYFGKNLVLLNNMVELSDGIVTNLDDLTTLVAIITNQSKKKSGW